MKPAQSSPHCKTGHTNDINVVIKISIPDTCAAEGAIMFYMVTFVKTLQSSWKWSEKKLFGNKRKLFTASD